MQEVDWNTHVKAALERTEFMALSTLGREGVWTAPVQFGYSEKLELYFKSLPASKHMQNLLVEDVVSAAIYKSERLPDGNVVGLQIRGAASFLSTSESVAVAARHYYGRDPVEHVGENAKWSFAQIVPSEAWYFDSRYFGEKRMRVDLENLRLPLDY